MTFQRYHHVFFTWSPVISGNKFSSKALQDHRFIQERFLYEQTNGPTSSAVVVGGTSV